jgi:hypothetical protein
MAVLRRRRRIEPRPDLGGRQHPALARLHRPPDLLALDAGPDPVELPKDVLRRVPVQQADYDQWRYIWQTWHRQTDDTLHTIAEQHDISTRQAQRIRTAGTAGLLDSPTPPVTRLQRIIRANGHLPGDLIAAATLGVVAGPWLRGLIAAHTVGFRHPLRTDGSCAARPPSSPPQPASSPSPRTTDAALAAGIRSVPCPAVRKPQPQPS